jgi:hypothetical protein
LAIQLTGRPSNLSAPLDHLIGNPFFPTASYAASVLPNNGNTNLFQLVLKHIEITVTNLNLFKNWTDSSIDTVKNSPSIKFHDIWSAMSFLSCVAVPSGFSDIERFGDGFTVAGCLFIHLLEQRKVFELTDLSYYVLRVHAHDRRSAAIDLISASQNGKIEVATIHVETEEFVVAASECFHLQQTFFNMIEKIWSHDVNSNSNPNFNPNPSPNESENIGKSKIRLFRPPRDVY